MFYLMRHSTHFIYCYSGVGNIEKNDLDSDIENPLLTLCKPLCSIDSECYFIYTIA